MTLPPRSRRPVKTARRNDAAAMSADRGPAIAVVAAVAKNGVIGVDDRLPWRLPADLKRFRALTTGHAVIMGRKTWESLPHALPDRQNIVVSQSPDYRAEGADTATSFADALAKVDRPAPIFCIGGESLYREALAHADTLHITEIDRPFPGDAKFPQFDAGEWREVARETRTLEGPDGFNYAFVTYRRAGI